MPDDNYKYMLATHPVPSCWACGRGMNPPDGWFGPWLIERAHIVNSPRREDRRVVILLCSFCHRIQHGEQLILPGLESLTLTIREMLWLKKHYDRRYYDRKFIKANSNYFKGKLPNARRPRWWKESNA